MSPVSAFRSAAARVPPNLQGMLWMAAAGISFIFFTGIARHVGSEMHPVQAAFLRYAIGLVFVAPLLLRYGRAMLYTSRTRTHAFRGLIHGIAVMLWFYAMARIPIAEVTALGFTAPIFSTVGAAMFLGERLHLRRIGAVLMGFAGALIILRPGVVSVDPGAVAMIVAAPLFAVSKLLTKSLTGTDSGPGIVAYLALFVTLVMLPPAMMVWRAPTWEEIGWLTLTALLATTSHLAMTHALKLAELTVTQPVEFLQLVWATLLGLYIFNEVPDIWTWVGGAVIVGSATYIAHREAVAGRRAAPAPAPLG